LAFGDVGKLFKPDGSLKLPHELTAAEAACLSSIETLERFEGVGEDRKHIGTTRKVRMWDKLAALEKLGKHLGCGRIACRWRHSLLCSLDLLLKDCASILATKLPRTEVLAAVKKGPSNSEFQKYEKYHDDPVGFAHDILKVKLVPLQQRALTGSCRALPVQPDRAWHPDPSGVHRGVQTKS